MSEPLHVLDLPQVYQKPSYTALSEALSMLSVQPSSFENDNTADASIKWARVYPEGVPNYLTGIIGNALDFLATEDEREIIWNLASQRLSERSGRTAMGAITRSFSIPTSNENVDVRLHEPALTGDNLGLKTWSSSFRLAGRLHLLELPMPIGDMPESLGYMALELGSGTGLLGLVAAAIWPMTVILTDLPDITPNLANNIKLNSALLSERGGRAISGVLDWTCPDTLTLQFPPAGQHHILTPNNTKAMIILAADPIYSPLHPRLLVSSVSTWLSRDTDARFIMAHPHRDAYVNQIEELRNLLKKANLVVSEEGTETGKDDWKDDVAVAWSVWRWHGSTLKLGDLND